MPIQRVRAVSVGMVGAHERRLILRPLVGHGDAVEGSEPGAKVIHQCSPGTYEDGGARA